MAVTSGAPDPRRIYLVTKHSVFLGWLAIAAWAGAGVMWFVRLQRHSALSAQYYERSGSDARSFEPFLDNEYLFWWKWAWALLILGAIFFTGAVVAAAMNAQSERLVARLAQSAASEPTPAPPGAPSARHRPCPRAKS